MDTTITTDLGGFAFFLQMSDSAFPTGAYAHSCGLEELARAGVVSDEASLLRLMRHQVVPSLVHLDLPLLREVRTAAGADDFEEILRLDALAGAMRLPRELREASGRIGVRRLQTVRKLYPSPLLTRLEEAVAAGEAQAHHVTVFGCACRSLPMGETLASYFYQTVGSFCSASLKLLRIGQEGAQRVLSACLEDAPAAIEKAMGVPADEIGWFDIATDLASMRHEIANERLFIS